MAEGEEKVPIEETGGEPMVTAREPSEKPAATSAPPPPREKRTG